MNAKNYVILSVFLGIFLFVLGGCKSKENPFPDHAGGKIFQGLTKVNVNCASCHGTLGGGGMRAPALTKSVKTLKPDQFVATVINGRGGMPAFNKVLQEEEILQIVDWLTKLPD